MTRLSFLVSLTVDFQYSAMVEGQRSASQPSKVGESLLAHGPSGLGGPQCEDETSSHGANHDCGSFTATPT